MATVNKSKRSTWESIKNAARATVSAAHNAYATGSYLWDASRYDDKPLSWRNIKTAAAAGLLVGTLESWDNVASNTGYKLIDRAKNAAVETYDTATQFVLDRLDELSDISTGRFDVSYFMQKPVDPSRKQRIDDGYSRAEVRLLESMIQQQYARILGLSQSGRIPLRAMIKTVDDYDDMIRREARRKGVPEHVALGIAGIENGGGTDKKTSCCVGLMQLSWNVGVAYGAVNCDGGRVTRTRRGRYLCKGGRWNDRRKNPLANVRAGIAYDSDLYDNHFQDWGLAAQAHHAGEVNVKRGVSKHIEYKTRKGKRRGRIISWKNVNPAVIEREDAGWIKIMQDGPARRFMESLADESALYLPKSQAMWRLYRDRGSVLKNPAIK